MVNVTPIALGYNTVYLVAEGSECVLIDTGPDYRGAREVLKGLLGAELPSLVVATHGHIDHAGLGWWWQEQGVRVALGAGDLAQAMGTEWDTEIDHLEAYLEGIGAPPAVVRELEAGLEQRRRWAKETLTTREWNPGDGRWPTALHYRRFKPDLLVDGPTELPCGLLAFPAPGHTPGNLVVVHRTQGILFSGDQLLRDMTPTPAIQFHGQPRFHSLPAFVNSLRAIEREFPGITQCFPGHGPAFEGVQAVIDANIAQAEDRAARILGSLIEEGGAPLYGIAERLYPRALRRRTWQIIATIQGHLDLLQAQGLAVESRSGSWLPAEAVAGGPG